MVGYFVLVSDDELQCKKGVHSIEGSTGEKIKNFEKIRVKTSCMIQKLSEWQQANMHFYNKSKPKKLTTDGATI